jgi:magnesium-transporting ATPase (P-type)
MILTLITLGKFLETRAKGRTGDAIRALMDLSPKTAVVLRGNTEQEIPVEEVRCGDVILVRSGGSIPVDGTVLEGRGSVDQSALTGESVPVEKGPGDSVSAACINVEIAYSKTLTSQKKYAEADKVLRAAKQFKGAKPGSYYAIQEAIMMNMLSKRDQAAAKKELELLKQMPGSKNGKILAEVRYLTSFNMNKEAVDLLVKSAEDTSFSKNVRAGFYGSAAFFAVSRLHNIKLSESYYAKAKELMGPKYKNTQVENSLKYWRRKL